MSPTPPGAASATGSTHSESGHDSESHHGRSDDRTEEVPVLAESPAQEDAAQEEPSVEDEVVAPRHPPLYDQTSDAPYDQTATEDALPTLAGPAAPVKASSQKLEPESEPESEPEPDPPIDVTPTANDEALSSDDPPVADPSAPDDTAPLDAPIGRGGANGYAYGDPPVYAEAPAYGDPSGYGDQPVYDGAPSPSGPLAYGETPGDELAYGAVTAYGDTIPTTDPSAYGDQFAYGTSPVPIDQLTYADPPANGEAPAYGEPFPFGQAPVVEAPFGQPPFGQPPFGDAPVLGAPVLDAPFGPPPLAAPPLVAPWPQPDVPAGPVLLPPPTGTPGRGVRSVSRPKPRRPPTRKGRRVKRVVRRIELWSVLKVSLLFYFCMYLVALAASALLWGFAYSAGLIENFESFMADIGFEDFQFFGDQLFKEVAIVGAVLVVAGALLTVLAVALVNLISEVTGGVRFVVIEIDADERPAERPSARPS